MDVYAYARQLKALLPQGRLWRLETDSVLSRLLLAISSEFVRVDDRSEDLLREWDPRSAIETLPDWEKALGIVPPDGSSRAARQLAAAGKLIARGGQMCAYFISLAASLGFVVTIDDVAPYVWAMHVDLAASSNKAAVLHAEFRAGTARAGDRLNNWAIPQLEDVINKSKPAHSLALFVYTD